MLLWYFLSSVAAILVSPMYGVVRAVIHAMRDAIWWLNGTHAAILKSRTDTNGGQCVQVCSIWGRYKTDTIAHDNFLTDFILHHDRFEEPKYIMKWEISLYCITPREFVFVQCLEGDTAWDVKDFGFSRDAQHKKAIRVLLLPIHAAHRLATEFRGRPKQKLIFILNTTRCGSTLACQMFQDTDRCVAYSEPAVFNTLLRDHFNPHHSDPEAERLIKTAVILLCKPSAAKGTTTPLEIHALKLQPTSIPMIPLLTKLFPHSPCVFLYRDIKAICLSFLGLNPVPFSIQLIFSYLVSVRCMLRLFHSHGFWSPHIPYPDVEAFGSYSLMAVFPVVAIHDYLDLCKKEIPNLCAIRYEDLIREPFGMVSRVFQFCGLPQSCVQSALRDLDKNPQTNSALSKRGNRLSLNAAQISGIKSISSSFGLHDILDESFRVPGTLGVSSF